MVKIRHFITNIICGMIYNQNIRRRVRVVLNSPVLKLKSFIKKDCKIRHPKFKFITGFRGRNLLIRVDDKYIYKYPTQISDFAQNIEVRERDITRELARVSPIFIPQPTLLNFGDKIIRRYDVVDGLSLRELVKNKPVYNRHKKYLARQIAEFLYEIARVDPKSIYKYKDNPSDKPGFFRGWHHCDLLDNFMIDEKTYKIIAFIDWEEVAFGDFTYYLLDKNPVMYDFMKEIKSEYETIYKNNQKAS